ncbi:efflux RND transporter periplasmic adaptor subunit [Shewanella sp. NIFS-20-20]|uniref:efflux RND transporter periplasmic adaptor subunit n=1 Tax=Shewanella sp. NIFS-20-20 TaxID=2853806 RepID=UPI001C46764B|nr:efflux RND transporter periplasmic adaptor subunit [Shewanella sp. NIFS-20-20]MBV7316013.1 efflux RND transporter periplasmic adaptor subunit [Shewanella sp. NIFS-20-20]
MMLSIPERESWFAKPTLWGIVMLFVALLTLSLWQIKGLASSPVDANIPLVQVTLGDVASQAAAYGRLIPRVSSSLVAKVEGNISQLHAYPGTEVEPGQAILSLVNPQLQREFQIAQLEWQIEQANYQSETLNQQRRVTELANEIAIAKSEITFADKEISTLTVLHKQQLIGDLEFLRANTRVEQLYLKLELLNASADSIHLGLAAERGVLDAKLKAAKLRLALIESDMIELTVLTNSSGIIGELGDNIEVGQVIRKGDLIAKLTDPDTLYARLNILAMDASDIAIGMLVKVELKGQFYMADIIRIHPAIEDNQITVEAQFHDDLPSLAKANQSVSASVIRQHKEHVLRLTPPIYFDPKQSQQIFYVKQGADFVATEVTVGLVNRDVVEVISGLREGDWVAAQLPFEQ